MTKQRSERKLHPEKTSGWQQMNSLLDWKSLILKHVSLSSLYKSVLFQIDFILLGNVWGSQSVPTSSSKKKPQESKEVCGLRMNCSCTMTECTQLTKSCKKPKESFFRFQMFKFSLLLNSDS